MSAIYNSLIHFQVTDFVKFCLELELILCHFVGLYVVNRTRVALFGTLLEGMRQHMLATLHSKSRWLLVLGTIAEYKHNVGACTLHDLVHTFTCAHFLDNTVESGCLVHVLIRITAKEYAPDSELCQITGVEPAGLGIVNGLTPPPTICHLHLAHHQSIECRNAATTCTKKHGGVTVIWYPQYYITGDIVPGGVPLLQLHKFHCGYKITGETVPGLWRLASFPRLFNYMESLGTRLVVGHVPRERLLSSVYANLV